MATVHSAQLAEQGQHALAEHDGRIEHRAGHGVGPLAVLDPVRNQPAKGHPERTQPHRVEQRVFSQRAGQRLRDSPEGASALNRPPAKDSQPDHGRAGGNLLHQPGLSDPRLTGDQQQRAVATRHASTSRRTVASSARRPTSAVLPAPGDTVRFRPADPVRTGQ